MALSKDSEICSARPGDTVRWTNRIESRLWKVVQNWTASEPRQLLLTSYDDESEKCYTALAVDCELVERNTQEPKTYSRKRSDLKPLPNYLIPNDGGV